MTLSCVFYMFQTLRQEKRVKSMGALVPGVNQTVLLLGGGECGRLQLIIQLWKIINTLLHLSGFTHLFGMSLSKMYLFDNHFVI